MSSSAGAVSELPATDPPSGVSAGAMLRNAREKTGLHIGALSVSLKVPVSKLEALEADRLDLLPDAVFARALASSVCRALKLDPVPVLAKLPGHAPRRLQSDGRMPQTAFHTPAVGWRTPVFSRLSKPAVVAVGVLLLAVLAVLFVPSLERLTGSADSVADAPGAASEPMAAVTSIESVPAAADATQPSAPSVAGSTPAMSVANQAAPAPAAASVNAALGQAAAASAAASSEAPGAGLVVFKTRGASWLEVTDAAGVVQLRKTLGPGETAAAAGTPPLSVTVGRADSTEVLVRGKAFDLAPVSKDNVARFQIK